MNIKKTITLSILGAVICMLLRFSDFMFFFDSSSGFATNGSILSYIGIGVIVVICLIQIIAWIKNRDQRFLYEPAKSPARAVLSFITSLAALYGVYEMYDQYVMQSQIGVHEFSATGLSVRFPFLVITGVLAVYMLFYASVSILNKESVFIRVPLLGLIPIFWGLIFVLYTFIHYSISFIVSENIFVIFSACTITLFLLNKAKYISGIDEGGKCFRKILVTGSLAMMFSTAYVLSNILLSFFGIVYVGDLPFAVELILLALSADAFVFIITAKNKTIKAEPNEPRQGKRFK